MSRRTTRAYRSLYDKEQEELTQEKLKTIGPIHRGDIFYFEKTNTVGVEQWGGRPGIVVSTDECNNSSEFVLVCYLTTQTKTKLPTHVPIVCKQESICLCEQVHTLSKEKMHQKYGSVTPEEMAAIDKALITTLGIDIKTLTPDEQSELIKKDEVVEVISELEEKLKEKEIKMREYIKRGSELEAEIERLQKQTVPIEMAPEYIRACAERDVYMKLYNDLLNKSVISFSI